MSLSRLLSELQTRGIELSLEESRLNVASPPGAMTPDLRVQLRHYREEIIAFLSQLFQEESQTAIRPVLRSGRLPLSFAQQRLWILDQLGNGIAYNMRLPLKLTGPLDLTALKQALQEIVCRHESLRTTFAADGGTPYQVIHPEMIINLPVIDLSAYKPDEQAKEVQRLTTAEATCPFDLSRDPMLRATLLRCTDLVSEEHDAQQATITDGSSEQHILLLTMHHIASDGWSLGVLMRELAALYEAFSQDQPSPLPDLPIQYADFAVWQRNYLKGAVGRRQVDHWKKHLDGAPELLQLPTDCPRPAQQSFRGDVVRHTIDADLTQQLRRLSQEQGATLYMTLLAAFEILVSRYSGQTDVVVGSPIANRNRQEIEPLIGFFVNTLALRCDLSGKDGEPPTFLDVLAQLQETTQSAYDHQDLPFERLVEELQPDRNISYNPLVQVIFALQNASTGKFELPGLTVEIAEIQTRTTRFDLEIYFWEEEYGLQGYCIYSTDLFDKATITRMMCHFQTLLAGIVADPGRAIAELPLLTEAERHQILVEWNDTATEYPKDKCVHQLFEEQAECTPHAIAAIFEDRQLTYWQLNEKANQLAHYLQGLGIGPETLVGLCLERSLELLIGVLGILKAGGAYLPLGPDLPTQRLEFMLQNADVACLITRQTLLTQLPEMDCHIICLDSDRAPLASGPRTNPTSSVAVSNLVYLMYTSGSTGRPKGVEIRHRSVVNFLRFMQREPGFDANDRLLAVTTFGFDIAVLELLLPLITGGSTVIAPIEAEANGEVLQSLLKQYDISVMQATPATWQLLIQSGWQGLQGLKMLCGGEELPRSLAHALLERGGKLWNMYGPTETTIWSSVAKVQPDGPIHIGWPIANTQLYVLDALGQPVPQGVVGELAIGGDGVARGYRGRADLTAERFVDDSFRNKPDARMYRTGDLVRFDVAGRLLFLGRQDNQVKLRGFRIELDEIEAVLSGHPSVAQCVVTLREDRPGDKRLVAYCLSATSANLNFIVLARHLRRQLPDYMIPTAFVALNAIPLTPSGKIDRRALPAPDYSQLALESVYVPPRNPIEEQLTAIWHEVLGVERVGIHDSFFKLGGHSLLAAQLIAQLRMTFQVELPLSQIFEAPTIADLAETIAQARQSSDDMKPLPPVEAVMGEQPLPLSFAQRRLWFLDQLGAGAAYNTPLQLRVAGSIDEGILRRTLVALTNRHETLRTTYAIEDGRPYQQIAPALGPPLDLTDISHLSIEDAEREVMRLAREHLAQPFDLAKGPLLSVLLVRMAHEDVLIISIHHSICDGWSLSVLQNEIVEHYRAFSMDVEPQLPTLQVQYADYAVWQHRWLDEDVLRPQLAYWQRQLGGELPVLDLPTDRPRPTMQTFGGASCSLQIPAELVQYLKLFNRKHGVTMATTLLAVFKLLLARYSGQEEIVVGSPIAGRTVREIEDLIGFFVNTLVLRTDLSGDPTFEMLLKRVHHVALKAYDHQDLPFERLVDELAPERDLAQNPLFQVVFALQYGHRLLADKATSGANPPFRRLPVDVTVTRTDIELHMYDQGDRINGQLVYNTDLFDASTIKRMVEHYLRLLQNAVASPADRISRLVLLSDRERQQLLFDWNRTEAPFPDERCIHELIEDRAAETPDAPALVFEDRRMSYGRLNAAANQVAHTLRDMGVEPDTFVGLCLERCPEMIVGLLGILKAGGAYVPIDPTHPPERLSFMLNDSRAPVLLTQAHLLDSFPDSVDPNLAFLAIFSRDCRDFGVIYSDFGYRKQPISYLKIAQI